MSSLNEIRHFVDHGMCQMHVREELLIFLVRNNKGILFPRSRTAEKPKHNMLPRGLTTSWGDLCQFAISESQTCMSHANSVAEKADAPACVTTWRRFNLLGGFAWAESRIIQGGAAEM